MSEHYYTQKPTTQHERQTIREVLRGQTLSFVTDSGVFSKSGVDYGSRLLIETMDFPADAKVLDVGCGYGPIGLSAARMVPQGSVTMIDINERAVELARHNAAQNGIQNVEVLQSDLLARVQGRQYDHVLTNPPIRAGKQTVYQIFEQARNVLVEGGSLWVVIQKKQGAPSAFVKLAECYGEVHEAAKSKGYRIYRAIKK